MILDVFDTFEIILLNFLVLVYSYLIENSVNLEEVEQYILKVSEIEQLGLSKILEQRLSQYLRTNQRGKDNNIYYHNSLYKEKNGYYFFHAVSS